MDRLDDQVFTISSDIGYFKCKSGDVTGILECKRMVDGVMTTRYVRWGPGLHYETELAAIAYLENFGKQD